MCGQTMFNFKTLIKLKLTTPINVFINELNHCNLIREFTILNKN